MGQYLPTVGETVHFVFFAQLPEWSDEIIRRLVVVDTEKASSLAKTPSGYVNGADIAIQVAIYSVASVVVDQDALTITMDAGPIIDQRHLHFPPVHRDPETRIDFNLASIAQDREGFAGHFRIGAFVVDHGTELVAEEVVDQEVAAFPGEFIVALVKGHVVLRSGDKGVAPERRQYGLDPHWPVSGKDVHGAEVELAVIHVAEKVSFGSGDLADERHLSKPRQLTEIFPCEGQLLRVLDSA